MVSYEVNLAVDENVLDDFLPWLDHHIDEMLRFDGFQTATIFEDEEHRPGRKSICVHYHVDSREDLEKYFNQHAEKMRDDGKQRFPNKFSATRRILTKEKDFERKQKLD